MLGKRYRLYFVILCRLIKILVFFSESTSAKLLEKWSTNIKPKVISQSRDLAQTGEVQDLIQNAVATEVEEGKYIVPS